jgi:hypothetical protein
MRQRITEQFSGGFSIFTFVITVVLFVIYLTLSVTQIIQSLLTGLLMYNEVEKMQTEARYYTRIFLEWLRKSKKFSPKIAGLSSKIWTRDLHNKKQQCYQSTATFAAISLTGTTKTLITCHGRNIESVHNEPTSKAKWAFDKSGIADCKLYLFKFAEKQI